MPLRIQSELICNIIDHTYSVSKKDHKAFENDAMIEICSLENNTVKYATY